MTAILIDSNVLLDVLTEDERWFSWSSEALASCADASILAINPAPEFQRLPLPFEAAFLAGKAFLRYRGRGGARRAPLPDFFIGAHAAVSRLRLLTRDPRRYRSYFPRLELIAPDALA